MLGEPAGWYQDPLPTNPAAPDTLRYWDGVSWTGQVRLASKRERQEWRAQETAARTAYVQDLVDRSRAGDAEAQDVLSGVETWGAGSRNLTPDGQRLSGWWRRVAAYLIDHVIMGIVVLLLTWRWIQQVMDAVSSYTDSAFRAAEAGVPGPDPALLTDGIVGPSIAIAVVSLLVGLVYEVGFLRAFQATPGKMVLGIEVRLRAEPGPLPWGCVLLRWLTKTGVGILQLVPFGLFLVGIYFLVDYLWPLGDSKRQALHDKAAATNVARRE